MSKLLTGEELVKELEILLGRFARGTYAEGYLVIKWLRTKADEIDQDMQDHMSRD
jgi:hypothetical protein